MKQSEAAKLAIELMREHDLLRRGWQFGFDDARARAGQCNYSTKTITLTRFRTYMHSEAIVRNTILHEIAHALAGPDAGHGKHWKQIAKSIGCTGDRCFSDDRVRITGSTFPVKDALARLGAKYDYAAGVWVIEEEKFGYAHFIVRCGNDGKVRILVESRKIEIDFTRPVYCSCEKELPPERKTIFRYTSENVFAHHCGRNFQVLTGENVSV